MPRLCGEHKKHRLPPKHYATIRLFVNVIGPDSRGDWSIGESADSILHGRLPQNRLQHNVLQGITFGVSRATPSGASSNAATWGVPCPARCPGRRWGERRGPRRFHRGRRRRRGRSQRPSSDYSSGRYWKWWITGVEWGFQFRHAGKSPPYPIRGQSPM